VPDPIAALRALPRVDLRSGPTPLQFLSRYSDALGHEVWCKRDDHGSVGLAGNKVRKFEMVLGRGIAQGADTLITAGAIQSNSARAGAAAAAALGMRCILLLSGDPVSPPAANLLLDRLFGAEIRIIGDVGWAELVSATTAAADDVRGKGGTPVVAPVGCSSPLGSLGFALAYLELLEQLEAVQVRPGAIVHASSSLGTHAGLLLGAALAGRGPMPIGIDVAQIYEDLSDECSALAGSAAALIGWGGPLPEPRIVGGFMGEGYASITPGSVTALRRLAATEALLVDPVYSAKGLAGLESLLTTGKLTGPVVFWHTGGYHALFEPAVSAAVSRDDV